MQIQLRALVFLFVPVLGLNSCSKDREVDNWRMPEPAVVSEKEPVIETAQATGERVLAFSSAGRRLLPEDAALRFAAAGETPDWVRLDVQSNCSYEGRFYLQTLQLGPHASIGLKNLWPAQLWQAVSNADLQKSECDFKFTATNKAGSTHEFSLDRVKLKNFAGADERAIESSFSAQKPLVGATQEANRLFLNFTNAFASSDEVRLVCGKEAVATTIEAASRSSYPLEGLMQLMGLHGRQSCRLIVSSAPAAGDAIAFRLTDDLPFKFPSVVVSVRTELPFALQTVTTARPNIPLIRFIVSNETDEPALLAPLAANEAAIRLVAVSQGRLSEQGTSNQVALNVFIDGQPQGPSPIAVPAHGQIVIELNVAQNTLVNCLATAYDVAIMGLRFGFLDPLTLTQLDHASEAQGTAILKIPPSTLANPSMSVVFPSSQPDWGLDLQGQTIQRLEPPQKFCGM